MNKSVLQIPLNIELKAAAEKAADDYGFSSLQELVRVFLNKISKKTIEVTFVEKRERLSVKAEKQYLQMVDDFKKNKKVYQAADADDFIKQLHGN